MGFFSKLFSNKGQPRPEASSDEATGPRDPSPEQGEDFDLDSGPGAQAISESGLGGTVNLIHLEGDSEEPIIEVHGLNGEPERDSSMPSDFSDAHDRPEPQVPSEFQDLLDSPDSGALGSRPAPSDLFDSKTSVVHSDSSRHDISQSRDALETQDIAESEDVSRAQDLVELQDAAESHDFNEAQDFSESQDIAISKHIAEPGDQADSKKPVKTSILAEISSRYLSRKFSQGSSQDSPQELSQDLSQESSQDPSQELPQGSSQDSPQELFQDLAPEASQGLTQELSETGSAEAGLSAAGFSEVASSGGGSSEAGISMAPQKDPASDVSQDGLELSSISGESWNLSDSPDLSEPSEHDQSESQLFESEQPESKSSELEPPESQLSESDQPESKSSESEPLESELSESKPIESEPAYGSFDGFASKDLASSQAEALSEGEGGVSPDGENLGGAASERPLSDGTASGGGDAQGSASDDGAPASDEDEDEAYRLQVAAKKKAVETQLLNDLDSLFDFDLDLGPGAPPQLKTSAQSAAALGEEAKAGSGGSGVGGIDGSGCSGIGTGELGAGGLGQGDFGAGEPSGLEIGEGAQDSGGVSGDAGLSRGDAQEGGLDGVFPETIQGGEPRGGSTGEGASQAAHKPFLAEGFDAPEAWPEPPDPQSELGVLRQLIMGREIAQLGYLSRTIVDPNQHANALSQVITEALLLRTRRDDKLNTVLGPTVERIFTSSVRRNPETLAHQIFPVIGPAIRRSISETFLSMIQDLNSTLEMSLSLKGLKWRLEALRARKPFSEIVMMHTLLYHVEEIYLIHAETGLVLDHLVYEGGEARDADLVAGMFTAILDFIKDSFSVEQGDSLDNMRFGDRAIYIRRADQVYMACVVRGNPPASLARDLQAALELMVVDCAQELDDFKGNVEPFKKARRFFEDFLKVRYQDLTKKPPLVMRLLPVALIAIIVAFALMSVVNGRAERRMESERTARAQVVQAAFENAREARERVREAELAKLGSAMDRLGREPGLVVTRVVPEPGGRAQVVILRDNLAREPLDVLAEEEGFDPSLLEISSKPYVSLDGEIVRQRLIRIIDPLPTVEMDFDEDSGLLTLTGTAALGWILEVRDKAMTIPGVSRVDSSKLTDPRTMSMEVLVEAINGVVIHFPTNSFEPTPEDAPLLVKAVDNIVALEELAGQMRMSVTLVIYGHADAIGTDRRNFELSESRTKTIAAMLYARGSSMPIVNYGLGSQFSPKDEAGPPKEDPESRKIELRVRLTQSAYQDAGIASNGAWDAVGP